MERLPDPRRSGRFGIGHGVARDDENERLLPLRPTADTVEEAHGRGRVRQRGKPGFMQRGDQHAASDPDAFGDVVVLGPAVLFDATLALGEDDDQPGRRFEERLVGIGPQGGERLEPFLARLAGVEFRFLGLGSFTNGALLLGRGNDGEMPWLVIGPVFVSIMKSANMK